MNSRQWWLVQIFIIFCGRLAHAATEAGVTSTVTPSPIPGEPLSSATPAPGGTAAAGSTNVGTTEAVTLNPTLDPSSLDPTLDSSTVEPTLDYTATTSLSVSEAPTVVTEAPPATTVQPVVTSEGCLCDLTPDFCDIGCCCDTLDCGFANLSTVFTGCPQKAISGVCIEKWLMFRANVDSSLVTVTDSLFCVRPEDKSPQPLPALPQYPALGDSYHFSPPAPTGSSHSRDFYRVDDVIQTYFSGSSVRGVLRQPSPGVAAAFCINRNPARFLRSVSLSCTRMLTPQSCTTDPNLNARSYFSDLSLIKIPVAETAHMSEFLIPVTPPSDWPAPSEQNNSCINVVKNVEFVIGYTGRGELTYATVNVVLADVDPNQLLLQTHSVQFQLATPSPTPGGPTPAVGLRVGSPVIGRFDGEVQPLSTLGVSQSGECSSDPSRRAAVLFTHNTITGCTFSSPSGDCSELRSQIYGILQGLATPDVIAMNMGSQPDWTRVITQECPVRLQEACESGCVLPNSLSIRVLWARQGLLDLPQNFILGAKYIFQCQNFKCPLSSPITLTTEVTFVDTTVYPEPPRGMPQPNWKFPFGFFTRGAAELDGHIAINSADTGKVTLSLLLFTVMLLTGLELITR
ncbi:tectonic-3-like isoform X2 [Epinephelus lanceolatus]|uniref:tectonic-3-like isoform X2 n=1 Tax=Epinephelus lanceolatus TaxID=310571 RepID=UPI0014469993|nr:tectonic-3-like isoform X2 [Epinephelus lanceolatus]